jgi:NAD(P)-dependent dehydrogenase (short-subunit alcohol dehydrogenase family)
MSYGLRKSILFATAGTAAYLGLRALARAARGFDLRGRVVLITGASRGLGLVLAREFAGRGCRLALCARNPDELQQAVGELQQAGGDVLGVPCDVTCASDVDRMVGSVRSHFGRIDVLVNNAGTIIVGPMEEMTLADYEEAMRTHFWGPLYTTLAVVDEMRQRRSGRILNVASIGGKIAVPHLLPYSASKFALVGLSEGLRAELAKDGVLVTTAAPGLMRTGSPRNATFKGQHRLEYAWFDVSDSLPGLSISPRRAAWRLAEAVRYGEAEVILSLPAKLAAAFHGIFPGVTADLLGGVNRLLPEPGGIGTAKARGKDSGSALAPSVLTSLSDREAARNNELGVS